MSIPYRTKLAAAIRAAGKYLTDNADNLVVNMDGIKQTDIWIRIPSLSENADFPEIQIDQTLNSHTVNKAYLYGAQEEEDNAN